MVACQLGGESHMAEAISLLLSRVLDEWDLTNKLHVVVRDNGMNVVAAMTCGHL